MEDAYAMDERNLVETLSPEFRELNFYLKEGHVENVNLLLDKLPVEWLASHKIQDQWALHCLHRTAFQEESLVEFTKNVILKYVKSGWEVNSEGNVSIILEVLLMDKASSLVTFTNYTLLHLACFYDGQVDIIKTLVEETGADVNRKTKGDVQLTPLQISLLFGQWDTAEYLIEKGADLNMRGNIKKLQFEGTNDTTWVLEHLNTSPNSIELLISLGCTEGLPVLDKILARPDVILKGATEFHLALKVPTPTFALKVLQHCAKKISKEDLTWVTVLGWTNGGQTVLEGDYKVPCLMFLLNTYKKEEIELTKEDAVALLDLVNLMVSLGYNLNLSCWETSIYSLLELQLGYYFFQFLKTLLQIDHLEIRLAKGFGYDILQHIMFDWDQLVDPICLTEKIFVVKAIKLLISHGIDFSRFILNNRSQFHHGYGPILKMLYCAGAKISDKIFTKNNQCIYTNSYQALAKENEELKQWKGEFDRKEGVSLKHLCRYAKNGLIS